MQGEKRKDVKDKLWKDVEEKKKNFFNIFFFGQHMYNKKQKHRRIWKQISENLHAM